MKLILCSVDQGLEKAWKSFCGDIDFVELFHGSIIDLECDAMVSPANSFGFMDGGIDALYVKHFGSSIQSEVKKQICDFHNGELVVGSADIIETQNLKIPFLVIAPTMRVPMKLHDSVNPYLAARATFILYKKGVFKSGKYKGWKIADLVHAIALPGLGTGVGGIGPNTCAYQVRKAIDDILLNKYQSPRSWVEASENHQLLYGKKLKDCSTNFVVIREG